MDNKPPLALNKVVVRVTWPIFYLDARNHISVTAAARVANFYVQVDYIKC